MNSTTTTADRRPIHAGSALYEFVFWFDLFILLALLALALTACTSRGQIQIGIEPDTITIDGHIGFNATKTPAQP